MGPTGERVKAFLRKHAIDGAAMSQRDYRDHPDRKAEGLPSEEWLYRSFANWQALVKWCGLDFLPYRKNNRPRTGQDEEALYRRLDAEFAAGRVALESAYDFRSIPAIDRGIKRIYDWRTQSYYEAHILELR